MSLSSRTSAAICLDASTVMALVLADEPLHDQAKVKIKALIEQGTTFYAPSLFVYECESVICLRVWKKKLTLEQAALARAAVNALPITIEFDIGDRDRAFEIATTYLQPRAYDASYAAYAEARGLEFLTIDKPFFESLNGDKLPDGMPALAFVTLLN